VANNPVNWVDPTGLLFAGINLSGSMSGSGALLTVTIDQGTTIGFGPSGITVMPISTGSGGFGPAFGGSAGGSASITIGTGDVSNVLGNGYSGSLALGPIGTFSAGFSSSGTLSLGYSNGFGLQFGIFGGKTETVEG